MTPAELTEKFFSLAAPVLGEAKARAVIDEVQQLQTRTSLQGLLSALQVASPSASERRSTD